MEILEREIPPELEALYKDVVELRPDSGLKFVRFVPAAGMNVGGQHMPDYTGDSEIRLVPDFDWPTLAHTLLHCLMYRKGYPVATTLAASDKTYSGIAQVLGCAAYHLAITEEAGKHEGLPPYWQEEQAKLPSLEALADSPAEGPTLLAAGRLADAIAAKVDAVETLAAACRESAPETWRVVEKLLEVMERCRELSAMRWWRTLAESLPFFDGIVAAANPQAVVPSRAVLVSLVVSLPQLSRPAERLVEIVALERDVVGFMHKQDRALFHIRFSMPGKQKREVTEVRADLKLHTEEFLNKYWVPYTVDLNVGKPSAANGSITPPPASAAATSGRGQAGFAGRA